MLYKYVVFYNGDARGKGKVETSSYLEAAKNAAKGTWTHITVIGKTIKRYDKNYKPISGTARVYRAMWRGDYHSILLMFGKHCEAYHFGTVVERDNKYLEIYKCITSTSVESARKEAEQTDTTASLEETRGTENSLTSKRTSNGSAMNAICKDLLTLMNTVRSSGKDKSKDTVASTWNSGLEGFLSKPDRTFLAKVKKLDDKEMYEWPGISGGMKAMEGKTYEFKSSSTHKGIVFKAKGFVWLPKWLDFENIKATPVSADIPEELDYAVGKEQRLTKCNCGCGTYFNKRKHYFKKEWLSV